VIIVDAALRQREEEGRPIRVGMVGAGAMGRALALQVATRVPGMEIVAISNRHSETAAQAYVEAGAEEVVAVADEDALADAMERGAAAYTDDPALLCAAEGIDVIWEVTGAVEFGAHVVLDAIAHRKHVVTMNAELQGTVGPLLKERADAAGVVLTDSDGDQPGVMMNLYRFVSGIGIRPVLVGNLKGLHDPYRNPTTQAEFARRHGLRPNMATSFADGTKVSFEMALVANATGLRAGRRGLYGPSCEHVREAADLFPLDRCSIAASSTTSSAPSLRRASSASVTRSIQSRRAGCSSTSSAMGRCTPSTRRTTFATSKRRRRSRARSCSATPPSPRTPATFSTSLPTRSVI
jgi:predicted homoserine dehydrogenase-like protein